MKSSSQVYYYSVPMICEVGLKVWSGEWCSGILIVRRRLRLGPIHILRLAVFDVAMLCAQERSTYVTIAVVPGPHILVLYYVVTT